MVDKLIAIKLISGEEIVCRVKAINQYSEDDYTFIISNPYVLDYSPRSRRKNKYSIEPWFNLSTTDEFELESGTILAMSPVENEDVIEMYKTKSPELKLLDRPIRPKPSDSTGYVGNVNTFRKSLEEIYKLEYNKDS